MNDFDSLVDDSQNQTASNQPTQQEDPPQLNFDNLKDDNEPDVKFDDLQDDSQTHSTPLQQLGTVAEGAAQGFAGPLATGAELGLSKLGVPNMTAGDISARAAANPGLHVLGELGGFGAGMFTGSSEAGVATNLAKSLTPEAETMLGKVGATALSNAIQGMVFQGSNEITNGLLGQGDKEHPVAAALANTGVAGLFSAALGVPGAFLSEGGSKLASTLESKNFAPNVKEFLDGMGLGSISTPEQVSSYLSGEGSKMTKYGIKAYQALHSKVTQDLTGAALSQLVPWGNDSGWERTLKTVAGAVLGHYVGPIAEKKIGEVLAPAFYKIIASGSPEKAGDTINYVMKAAQGENKINTAIGNLFNYGASKAVDYENPAKNIPKIKEFISKGGMDAQIDPEEPKKYSQGGSVSGTNNNLDGGLGVHLPDQNIMLNAAKARVSNFLKQSQPQPLNNKLAFDKEHRDPNKERQYDRVLKLANTPLSVLNHIKDGSLVPQHVMALKGMYPELHKILNKKIMDQVVDKVQKKEMPPYKMRQSLSMFLGQDLDSTTTPASIQGAQSVFMNQRAQNPKESKKDGISKASQSAMTADQARTKDLSKP